MSVDNPAARQVLLADTSRLDPALVERMENSFFKRLRLPNGTAKTTYRHRLDDVVAACSRLLAGIEAPLRLMDIGISSGVTTREWMDGLDALGKAYCIDAIDLSLYGTIESLGGALHVLKDSSGRSLQFEIFGLPLSNHYGYGGGSFVRRLVPVSAARAAFGLLWLAAGQRLHREPVQLLTRGLQPSARLRLHELDILRIGGFQRTFHLIRAANVLNRVYFTDVQLASILAQLRGRLDTNGYLVVVRTREGERTNDGTVFVKTAAGELSVAERFGEGSEVEPIVRALPAGF